MSIASARKQASAPTDGAGNNARVPPLEGQVHVLLQAEAVAHDGRDIMLRVQRAVVRSQRPAQTVRLLQGRTVEQAQALLPMLHSLCGQAHVAAFRLAARAARGEPRAWRAMSGRRDAPLLLEMLREHLVQALLGWPSLLRQGAGETGVVASLQRKVDEAMPLLRALAGASAQSAQQQQELAREMPRRLALLLGEDARTFLRRDAAALLRWMRASDSVAARLLRHLRQLSVPAMPRLAALVMADLPLVAERLTDDAGQAAQFAAEPVLDVVARDAAAVGMQEDESGCRISGAWARWCAHAVMAELPPLAALFMARLLDAAMLACLLEGGDALAEAHAALSSATHDQVRAPGLQSLRVGGMGVAAVDTARGLLVHAVALDRQQADGQERVARWCMVAPTEWHCHPHGVAARWLQRLQAADAAALEQAARLLMQAVDPCVGCAIEVRTGREAERADA